MLFMLKKLKTRLALLLCILLTMPTVISALPMATLQTVTAATSGYFYWGSGPVSTIIDGVSGVEMQVETGQKFHLGQMVYSSDTDYKYLSDVPGETYKSSNAGVVKVTAAGEVTAIKPGTAVIDIIYKGSIIKCKLIVAKKGAFGSNKPMYSKLKKQAQEVVKTYGTKVTAQNRYKISQALTEYYNLKNAVNISYNGFLTEEAKKDYGYTYTTTTNKLIIPEMLQVQKVENQLYDYVNKNNPIGTVSSKWLKISSISAKKDSDTFTINLKKKISSTDIFAIKYYYSSDSYMETGKKAVYRIMLKDTKTGYDYYGNVVATEGSKKLTVTMDYLKLKKGRTYRLYATDKLTNQKYGWTAGKTIKVK